jgi:hypothetical protein
VKRRKGRRKQGWETRKGKLLLTVIATVCYVLSSLIADEPVAPEEVSRPQPVCHPVGGRVADHDAPQPEAAVGEKALPLVCLQGEGRERKGRGEVGEGRGKEGEMGSGLERGGIF